MLKLLFFLLLIQLSNSFDFSNSKLNILIQEKEIKNSLKNLVENKEKIKLLNNPNQDWFLDCINIYCNNEDINLNIINYDNFIRNNYESNFDIILIKDFLIDYGRIIKNEEKEIIENYNHYSNIIMHINDYDNIILKDKNFIDHYNLYNFPYISKRNINNYIYNSIDYNKYHNNLQLINWKKYDIEKLNFEKIEDLLYKLHLLIISKKYNLGYIEYVIQDELSYLNKKFYD